ncbi:hypothetical protein GCK32_009849 [Trichostrongylus colubriformis]|uniref:Uncharacterized protein n=1 Tax=Trichostrongylus colubriformis TaxID=6319 RepID=A0AAN8ERI3_TRICO
MEPTRLQNRALTVLNVQLFDICFAHRHFAFANVEFSLRSRYMLPKNVPRGSKKGVQRSRIAGSRCHEDHMFSRRATESR